jgi:hypothetical protein
MISKQSERGADGPGAEPAAAAKVEKPAPTRVITTPVPSEPPRLRPALEAIGTVVAPTTVLSALLFYFGWVYSAARASVFGIDASLFGYSTQDYVLRSFQPVAPFLGTILLLGLVFFQIHSTLSGWVLTGRHQRFVGLLSSTIPFVGMVLLAAGLAGIANVPPFNGVSWLADLAAPLDVALGVIAVAYGMHLRRACLRSPQDDPRPQARSLRSAKLGAVFLLVSLNLLWAAGVWAQKLGQDQGTLVADTLAYQPGATVYSKQALNIEPSGTITVARVGGGETGYSFRYDGLKLLVHSGGRYFLVSADWSPAKGRVIVLPDDNSLRVEFAPGTG